MKCKNKAEITLRQKGGLPPTDQYEIRTAIKDINWHSSQGCYPNQDRWRDFKIYTYIYTLSNFNSKSIQV